MLVTVAAGSLVWLAPVVPLGLVAVTARRGDLAPLPHRQKALYRQLLLAEKLPAGIAGRTQIDAGINRATLDVAYRLQHPHRSTEVFHIALAGGGLALMCAVYYVYLAVNLWAVPSAGAVTTGLLVWFAAAVAAALLIRRAVGNFRANDSRCRGLFEHFGASPQVARPATVLWRHTRYRTAAQVLDDAADIRDASPRPMSTLAAVNASLARPEVSHPVTHQLVAGTEQLADRTLTATARGYDWLTDVLLGPLFGARLRVLDELERRRIARASESGDVFKAAWLPRHYRAERRRVARQWGWVHTGRTRLHELTR